MFLFLSLNIEAFCFLDAQNGCPRKLFTWSRLWMSTGTTLPHRKFLRQCCVMVILILSSARQYTTSVLLSNSIIYFAMDYYDFFLLPGATILSDFRSWCYLALIQPFDYVQKHTVSVLEPYSYLRSCCWLCFLTYYIFRQLRLTSLNHHAVYSWPADGDVGHGVGDAPRLSSVQQTRHCIAVQDC